MSGPKLTGKQRAFINAYLANGFNGTEAARTAGYSGNDNTLGVVAHGNLRNPKIAAVIEKRFEEMTMRADEVLARLSAMARTDMTDFMQVYPGGTPAFDFEKATEAQRLGLIKKFKVTKNSIELELYDAQAALVHMGKHYALFSDRVKHETYVDEILDLLQQGRVTPEEVREAIGDKLADDLFKHVGSVAVGASEATGESD